MSLFFICVSLFSFFNNKDKIMTTIFIFTDFGLNICHPFLYIATLKGFVFIKGQISLAVMLKQLQNRRTNTTKNPSSLCNDCLCLRCTSAPLSSSFALITDGRVVLKKISEKMCCSLFIFPSKCPRRTVDLVNFMQIVLFSVYQYQTLDD